MQTHQDRTGWSSWAMFAGLMMILVGIFQQIQGLVAIFNDDWYLVTNEGLALSVDYTVWGWVHFVLGLIVATAGVAVFNGKTWARVLGCVLALISAIAQSDVHRRVPGLVDHRDRHRRPRDLRARRARRRAAA